MEDIISGLLVVLFFFGGLYVVPWAVFKYIGYSIFAIWIAETIFLVAILLGFSIRNKIKKGK